MPRSSAVRSKGETRGRQALPGNPRNLTSSSSTSRAQHRPGRAYQAGQFAVYITGPKTTIFAILRLCSSHPGRFSAVAHLYHPEHS